MAVLFHASKPQKMPGEERILLFRERMSYLRPVGSNSNEQH